VSVILKDIISEPFNYVKQNVYLNILLDLLGEMVGVREGLAALQSVSTIK
jgi:hypothetical protein